MRSPADKGTDYFERWREECLTQALGQQTEQRQFQAFSLPRFEGQNDPEKKHGERTQDSQQQQNNRRSDIREKYPSHRRQEKHAPEKNALPSMKADETTAAKRRQEQQHDSGHQGEVTTGRRQSLGG